MTLVRHALVVGNGEPPSKQLFDELMADNPVLLCADGGADTATGYGYRPDYIVGDLDSAGEEAKRGLPADRLVLVDADDTGTDLQKVLRQAEQLGVTEAVLVGVTGGRTDHTLWNLSLLKSFGDRIELRIVDDYCDMRLLVKGKGIRFRAATGQKISLCPLAGAATGIRTRGLKFDLNDETLAPGERDGISNEVVDNPVEITVGEGDLLLCVQRQSATGRIAPETSDTAATRDTEST
jgi:thiamine pyrophosphokinase